MYILSRCVTTQNLELMAAKMIELFPFCYYMVWFILVQCGFYFIRSIYVHCCVCILLDVPSYKIQSLKGLENHKYQPIFKKIFSKYIFQFFVSLNSHRNFLHFLFFYFLQVFYVNLFIFLCLYFSLSNVTFLYLFISPIIRVFF